jgi:hypothetical protein
MAARRPISGLSNTSRRRLDLRFDVLDLLRKQVAQYACHGFGYRCQIDPWVARARHVAKRLIRITPIEPAAGAVSARFNKGFSQRHLPLSPVPLECASREAR